MANDANEEVGNGKCWRDNHHSPGETLMLHVPVPIYTSLQCRIRQQCPLTCDAQPIQNSGRQNEMHSLHLSVSVMQQTLAEGRTSVRMNWELDVDRSACHQRPDSYSELRPGLAFSKSMTFEDLNTYSPLRKTEYRPAIGGPLRLDET